MVVTRKQEAGSRKPRVDLMTDAINKHNRQAVGKARISSDETQAVYLFDQASAEVKKKLKLIWGTDAPQHTPVTLQMVGRGGAGWLPKKSLSNKIPAQGNPVWHEIGKHSWRKVEELLIRLETKWNTKCQEYLDRGVAPTIHHGPSAEAMRDAGRETEIAMMACFMVHFEDDLKKNLGEDEFAKVQSNWRTGVLDSKLMPEVVAMRPDFKLADLPFGTAAGLQAAPMLPEDFSLDEDAQEATRNLISLARQLKKEEDYMRGHRAAAHRHQVNSLAAECEWKRSVQGAVDVAYDEHSLYYSVQACKSLSVAQPAFHAVHRTLSARLLQKKEDVPCIAICNLPMLGHAASSLIRPMVAHIAQELAQAPSVTMYVMIPPNQTESGAGRVPKSERDRKVAAHLSLWQAEIEAAPGLQALQAKALFDHETMYSDERDLGFDLWLLVSDTVAENLQAQNVFGSSVLVKRKAIPGLVHCMPRGDMTNFSKDLTFAANAGTHGDADLEKKQWFSGRAFFSDLILAAVKGTKLSGKNTVLIRDETMYDAELALAVAKLNGMAQKSWPDLAYAGICWHAGTAGRAQIASNVESIIQDHVKGAISQNAYALAKVAPGVQARPVQCVGTAPTLKVEEFELTSPTASLELPMLESTIEWGKRCGKAALPESEVWKGLGWVDILKKHNDEFNPAGIVRSKRGADSSVDELPVCSHGVTCVSQFCCFLI